MKHASRRAELASILLGALFTIGGLWLIRDKLQEQPSTSDDLILSADEVRSLPADTLPVVILRENPSSNSRSLAYRVLSLVLKQSRVKHALGYGTTILDSPTSLAHIAASIRPSAGNPSGLTVGLYGAIEAHHPGIKRIDRPAAGGLLGLRMLCVNQRHQDRFAAIKDRSQLKPYVAVQGLGWGDADVLTANGLATYETAPSLYLSLLDQDRVDYLPRSLTSVEEECGPRAQEQAYRQVTVDRHLLIVYPNAWTFAVNTQNTALLKAISLGFERAYADGSLRALVQESFFTPWLKHNLNLRHRTLIVLSSPETDAIRRAIPAKFWSVPWHEIDQGRVRSGADLCRDAFFEPLC